MFIRSLLVFLHDAGAAALAWPAAYWLRFNMEVPDFFVRGMLYTFGWVVPAQAGIFWLFGLYRGMWRYASVRDLQRILLAVAVGALTVPVAVLMLRQTHLVPRSVLLLDPILLLLVMGGSRLAYRVWKEHTLYGNFQRQGKPVLVLGAGDAGVTLLRELERSPEWRVVGLLDDDPAKIGRIVNGVPVHGRLDDLPSVAAGLGAQHAIVAMPSLNHAARRRALQICSAARVKAMTVPSYEDLVSGKVTVSALREIELDDLLGRDPVRLDNAGLHQLLAGRTVLVSGAGGSIGAELCKQVARFNPRLLVLLELNEFALYRIEQELEERYPELPTRCAIGDVKDATRVAELFSRHAPSVVFHAAAYKHVPLMERGNAWAAVKNNALGTYVLASAAARHGVEKFVLVSTDKAVNPTSVMGATKRLAERICIGLQSQTAMQLVIVRFGNVLGSAGSVIPKFREQLARGGPITVTHPDVTRYFMSIREAAQLVLQAGLMGGGGEIFILDMGEPVRIVDLARDMIRLSGASEEEIRIVFTALRPGEKLNEELIAAGEESFPTSHPKLRTVRQRGGDHSLPEALLAWLQAAGPFDDEQTKAELLRWVPEYRPEAGSGRTAGKPCTAGRSEQPS